MGAFASIYYNGRQQASISDRELLPLPVDSVSGFDGQTPDCVGNALSFNTFQYAIGKMEEASAIEVIIEDQGTSNDAYEANITASAWT